MTEMAGTSRFDIDLANGRTAFAPGSTIRGTASWRLATPADLVELHLLWHTSGRGAQDVEVVKTLELGAGSSGDNSFELALPVGPYSFTGQLITLHWALEIVAEPDLGSERIEITLAPGAEAIRLEPVESKPG